MRYLFTIQKNRRRKINSSSINRIKTTKKSNSIDTISDYAFNINTPSKDINKSLLYASIKKDCRPLGGITYAIHVTGKRIKFKCNKLKLEEY